MLPLLMLSAHNSRLLIFRSRSAETVLLLALGLAVACRELPGRQLAPPSAVAAPGEAPSAVRGLPSGSPAMGSASPEARVAVPVPVAKIDPAEGIGLTLGPGGHLGAWLALGPFFIDSKSLPDPLGVADEGKAFRSPGDQLASSSDTKPSANGAKWRVVHAEGEAPIDLDRIWRAEGRQAIGYLRTTLRVPVAMQLMVLPAAADGVEVRLDGRRIFVRDEARPRRDFDDIVPFEVAPGDHSLVLKLHRRGPGWAVRPRLVDDTLSYPTGLLALLPGAPPSAAQELMGHLASVQLVREVNALGYALSARLSFGNGAPLFPRFEVKGRVLGGDGKTELASPPAVPVPVSAQGAEPLTVLLAQLTPEKASDAQVSKLSLEVDLGGRTTQGVFYPKAGVREALLRARELLGRWDATGKTNVPQVPEDVEATLRYLTDRLAGFVGRGDEDGASQLADSAALLAFVEAASQGKDPIGSAVGVMRLAHLAAADGKPQPLALYAPPRLPAPQSPAKRPLYVGLHGMNGGPMAMLRLFFGGDQEGVAMSRLDRGMKPPPPFDGYVLAPQAHGDAMYRQLGEEEVMDAIHWAEQRFPEIDTNRVYITGFSMGGTGAAGIPLHYPDQFAAAQPLCGYHSYAIRNDVMSQPHQPWEKFLIEDRSNVEWTENGARLPLNIIHGTKDLPEKNSGVLIEAYQRLHAKKGSPSLFVLEHDHPDKGHDVWGYAYEKLAQVRWFRAQKEREAHPRWLHLRTSRPRFGRNRWLQILATSQSDGWATVDGEVRGNPNSQEPTELILRTQGVRVLRIEHDPVLFGDHLTKLVVDGAERSVAEATGAGLVLGASPLPPGLHKGGHIAGPIRDVWNEPLVFVFGSQDPKQTEANKVVAKALASVRRGVEVDYPIMSDRDYLAKVAAEAKGQGGSLSLLRRSLVLVGNARSNSVTQGYAEKLPVRVVSPDEKGQGGHVEWAGKSYSGREVGVAMVFPHPEDLDRASALPAPLRHGERYLLLIAGVDAQGTLRALSLPDLLPDFVVWDSTLEPAHGQTLLGKGSVLAAGYFDGDWQAR